MKSVGMKLLTTMLLLAMLVSGFTGEAVSAAASDISIHVVRHIDHKAGTTRAAITVEGIPQGAKGLQFDLMMGSDVDEVSMTWNTQLLSEYTHYQDKAIGSDKVQRTYYVVAKAMPLESNSLYIGEAIYNNIDVKFETSGEVISLGDKLQQTQYQASLKMESYHVNEEDNGGNNNDSNGGGSGDDSSTPPDVDPDKPSADGGDTEEPNKPSTDDEDKQEPKPGDDGDQEDSESSSDNEEATNPNKPVSFDDISGHWAASSIQYVASKGIMNGTSKGKFEPNVTMTRAMFVQTLFNAEKVLYETDPQGGVNVFKDVAAGSWYEKAVSWAVEQGITSGLGNQTFGPQQEISREQMAVMMYQYCKLKGIDLPMAGEAEFKDQDQVNSWAEEAVAAIHGAGIMNGVNGNAFEPQAKAKRAEVAAVMERLASRMLSK